MRKSKELFVVAVVIPGFAVVLWLFIQHRPMGLRPGKDMPGVISTDKGAHDPSIAAGPKGAASSLDEGISPSRDSSSSTLEVSIADETITPAMDDYLHLVVLASTDRVSAFHSKVEPIDGSNLFDPFEISGEELAELAGGMVITRMENLQEAPSKPGETPNPPIPGVPDKVEIGQALKDGTLPMKLYDDALTSAMESLIDKRLRLGFISKHGLAPSTREFTVKREWTDSGVVSIVSAPGLGSVSEFIPDIKKEDTARLEKMEANTIESLILDMAVNKMKNRMDEFVTPEDRMKYFPAGENPNFINLAKFLRGNADITLVEPSEVVLERLSMQE